MGKELPRFMHVRAVLARRVSNRPMSVLEKGATGNEAAIFVFRTRLIVRSACRGGRLTAMSCRAFCWMDANRVSIWCLKLRFMVI